MKHIKQAVIDAWLAEFQEVWDADDQPVDVLMEMVVEAQKIIKFLSKDVTHED